MEASPLVQQARPSFQPKISQLYEELFVDEVDSSHSEGFWSEFFLLKPDKPTFQRRLEGVNADDLLHFQHETQQLFVHAVQHIRAAKAPSDEVALDTVTVFLAGVLSKRYTNPSSDIITVLAGLDQVDTVFADFANAIETCIRSGRTLEVRRKAVDAALSLTSGAYQTSLVSYFTHRDLFPALMKYIQDLDAKSQAFQPFLVLGLLANYNKFEYSNPYRLRLEDFVNEATIQSIVQGLGSACAASRDKYTAIIDDLPDPSWSLSNTLSYIGLGVLAPIKAINPIAAPEDTTERFTALPGPEAGVLLATYDFVNANKLFGFNLTACPAERKNTEPPLSAYLSFTSYILHHAFRSTRATLYGLLNLSTIRIILEDPVLCKRLCLLDSNIVVRLCRQRQPFLPPATSPRPTAAQILDIAIDTINHNLRRRLDVDLYVASLALIHRILACLVQNHIHFPYHWSLLWQSLLALLRFLATYSTDLSAQSADIQTLITALLNPLALAIASGNAFLPDPVAYDDLFYKLVEHADTLAKFKTTYRLSPPASPIDVLINTAAHFQGILEAEKGKGKLGRNLSMKEVGRVIRDGYESLDVPDVEGGWEGFEKWREGEERGMVKRTGRAAVEDARRLVREL